MGCSIRWIAPITLWLIKDFIFWDTHKNKSESAEDLWDGEQKENCLSNRSQSWKSFYCLGRLHSIALSSWTRERLCPDYRCESWKILITLVYLLPTMLFSTSWHSANASFNNKKDVIQRLEPPLKANLFSSCSEWGWTSKSRPIHCVLPL